MLEHVGDGFLAYFQDVVADELGDFHCAFLLAECHAGLGSEKQGLGRTVKRVAEIEVFESLRS